MPAAPAQSEIAITGIPAGVKRVLLERDRIDETHSDAYTAWIEMGSPQQPTPEQLQKLKAAGQLQTLTSPEWLDVRDGKILGKPASFHARPWNCCGSRGEMVADWQRPICGASGNCRMTRLLHSCCDTANYLAPPLFDQHNKSDNLLFKLDRRSRRKPCIEAFRAARAVAGSLRLRATGSYPPPAS